MNKPENHTALIPGTITNETVTLTDIFLKQKVLKQKGGHHECTAFSG